MKAVFKLGTASEEINRFDFRESGWSIVLRNEDGYKGISRMRF